MDDELQAVKDEILATMFENKDRFVAMENRVQSVVDMAAGDLAVAELRLNKKYDALPDATEEDYLNEYRALGEQIKKDTQTKLDALLETIKKENSQ